MEDPCAVLVCITSTWSANINRDGPIINLENHGWLQLTKMDRASTVAVEILSYPLGTLVIPNIMYNTRSRTGAHLRVASI